MQKAQTLCITFKLRYCLHTEALGRPLLPEISIMWTNLMHLHIICICTIIQVRRGVKLRRMAPFSCSTVPPEMNTNKTLAPSQNELHSARFISPLIQCTASTDEAAAWSYSTKHARWGMIAGSGDERRHMFIRSKGGTVKNNNSGVIQVKEHCGDSR